MLNGEGKSTSGDWEFDVDNVVGMIPARIGSTRFRHKNLALIGNKPVLQYAIEAALESQQYDRIVVNGDHPVFGVIADALGVEFYHRSEYLGGNNIKSDDVIIDFLGKFPCEVVVWHNAMTPLQQVEDLVECIECFKKNRFDSMFTTVLEQIHTRFHEKPLNFSESGKFEQTQELKPVELFVPFLMMWRSKVFREQYQSTGDGFFCGETGYANVSKLSSIAIKTEDDFRLCRSIVEGISSLERDIEYYDF